MKGSWLSAARARSGGCAVFALLGVCGAALPARAQGTGDDAGRPQPPAAASAGSVAAAAPIRATSDVRAGRGARVRFSLRRLLRDLAFGVSWDRARLPLHVPLRGSQNDAVSLRLTLSRRDFSGATLRLRF